MTPPALPPRRAVVLLNDPVLRSTTARALAEGGWRVNLAQSSLRRLMGWLDEEATSLPELIVCGLTFDDGDGLQLIRMLGEQDEPPALLLVTRQQQSVVRAAQRLADLRGVRLAGVMAPGDARYADELVRLAEGWHAERAATSDFTPLAPCDDAMTLLRGGRLVPFFQPKVRLDSREVSGFEALLRGKDGAGRWLRPAVLLPALEAGNAMPAATMVMAQGAVDFVRRCLEEGLPASASINVPLPLIADPAFCHELNTMVRLAELDPSWLTLEITESDAMGDLAAVVEHTARIRMLGFNLSIDDFGTAFASLQQLADIPFTELKIERAFVNGVDVDRVLYAIVSSCAQLGRALDLSIVAEGVETQDQLQAVARAGVTAVQGYLISRPLPGDDALRWLRSLVHNRTAITDFVPHAG